MDSKYQIIINELGSLRIKLNTSLKDYFGSKLDFKSNLFFMATTQPELIRSVQLARELEIKFLILGSGSKIILDHDFKGLIINNKLQNLKMFGVKGKVSVSGIGVEEAMIEAESGVNLSKLSQYATRQNLTGLEELEKTPGTIGGSVLSNVEITKYIHQVKVMDKFDEIINKKIDQIDTDDIILSAIFKLKSKKPN